MFFRRLTALAIAASLVGCQSSSHLVEFSNNNQVVNQLSNGEKRLWSESVDFDDQLRRSGKVLRNKDAKVFLNDMLYKLYPEYQDVLNIEVVKTPILNAFALPNGSLYIHSAIIASAQNESELAAVVAHEAAHFSKRHSAKSRISASNATSFALFVNLMGIPFLGELIGISSMMGYSRDLEREADMAAIERMKIAGYDIHKAHKIFEYMASDSLANDIDSPVFFSSHPELQERIANFKAFSQNSEFTYDQTTASPNFATAFSEVREYAIHEKLELGLYSSLINEYETTYLQGIYAQNIAEKYYFAEAYRLRNRDGDIAHAQRILEAYLLDHQDDHKAHLSMGIICLDLDDLTCSRKHLETAEKLKNGPSGYIGMYLKKLKQKENSNET